MSVFTQRPKPQNSNQVKLQFTVYYILILPGMFFNSHLTEVKIKKLAKLRIRQGMHETKTQISTGWCHGGPFALNVTNVGRIYLGVISFVFL